MKTFLCHHYIHPKQANKTIMSTHVIEERELRNQNYDYMYIISEEEPSPLTQLQTPIQSSTPSVLGKRKFCQSFDPTTFDDERYSQHISEEFFNTNVGHLVDPVTKKTSK